MVHKQTHPHSHQNSVIPEGKGFYLAPELWPEPTPSEEASSETTIVTVSGARAHYLGRVLRLKPGAKLVCFDGSGKIAPATVDSLTKDTAAVALGSITTLPAPQCQWHVATATPKGERADWLVEKLTELGVASITWLTTERSVVEPRQASKRYDRWQRLAQTAAAQARTFRLPALSEPVAFSDFITVGQPTPETHARLIASFAGMPAGTFLKSAHAWQRCTLLIGPEGGLTPQELAAAQQASYDPLWLGPSILRVETAAIAAVAATRGLVGR